MRALLPVYKSLDELAGGAEWREHAEREFRVPIDSGFDRRELLTLASASLALAGITGCTRQPTERIYPYVHPPEEVVPGEPLFFATAHLHGGYARGIVVESHEGRPTKIEGNALHPGSLGGTDVFMQAFLLNLYDPDRSQTLTERGEIRPWSAFLAAAKLALEKERTSRGAGLRFLTGPTTSPTLVAQMQKLLQAYPSARWIVWDAAASDAPAEGARLAFGEPLDLLYAFDRADVVLSLDADFLGSGPGQPRHARDFASRRRGDRVNRLYVAESTPTVTGAKSDHRRALPPDAVADLARAVAAAVGAIPSGPSDPFAAAVAKDLEASRGAGIVLAGDGQPAAVHALVHAINERLGNRGKTVVAIDRVAAGRADRTKALAELVGEMRGGTVTTLVILGGNPVFDAPADLRFADALAKVPLRIRLGVYDDETSRLCHWHVPEAHPLETWSDARGIDGTAAILQPLILPLFSGKSAHELLAAFSDQPEKTGHDLVKEYWRSRLPGDFESAWRRTLHDGVVADSASSPKTVALRPLPAEVAAAGPRTASGELTALFRPDPALWDGAYANNAWLQELPRPLTKLVWDNAALLSPTTAAKLSVVNGDVLEIETKERKIAAPAWILPGQTDDCVTLPFGAGRARGGRVANGKGFDAYALRGTDGLWTLPVQARRTGARRDLVATEHHYSMEGRDLVRSVTAARYREDPQIVHRMGEHPPARDETLYPPPPNTAGVAHAWGMAIDLSSCVGCNACVVACQAENNIPVVGKDQVRRGREMHWIRVDRYWSGAPESPRTYFQPVPCMHCENAPCETVCPVGATVHSAEGLNQMVYNRCVGTRYCSNNCPYKVRRFNFFLYADFRTELTKLVHNPDVSVRSRGVMEKCTYCVQRINRVRIAAERENRPIRDGEIVTACQQACPAQAIVFGNLRDSSSAVSRAKAEPRDYALLAELGTRPRTTYLADLRNPSPALSEGAGAAGEHA